MRVFIALGLTVVAGCVLPMNGLGPDGDTSPDGAGNVGVDGSSVEAAAGDAGLADTGSTPSADAAASEASSSDAATFVQDAASTESAAPDAPASAAGDALDFSGGAYVSIGQVAIPAEFTVEAWIRPTSISGETSILAQDRYLQAAGQFRLGLLASGQLFFILSDANGNTEGLFTGTGYALQSGQPVPLGTWTHVAVTRSKQTFTLFVNGAQVASFSPKGPPLAYGGPGVPMRVAARVAADGTSVDEAFTGTIDEVRFWNAARSGAQIAANMSQTVSPADPSLLGYWRFDDGSGTTASDSENRYPGTLVGPTWVASTAF